MNKRGKIIFGTVIGLMVAALIFGIVYAIIEKSKKITAEPVDLTQYVNDSEIELSGFYQSTSAAGQAASNLFMIFDEATASYTYASANQTLTSGMYTVSGNEVTTIYQDTFTGTNSEVKLLTDSNGKYIFFETNICSGDDSIPATGTFDAKFTKVDTSGTGYIYEFKSDGTYTTTYGTANDCTTWKTLEGTYWRNSEDPNIIERTLNGETSTQGFPMYSLNGRLVDAVYAAITEEEYNAEVEAAKTE